MDIKIIVATHKPYQMPGDKIYIPVHVGRAVGVISEDNTVSQYIGDNTGEHISIKNKNYCELTGIYWAWKNLDYDYLGLVHYRRYFKGCIRYDKWGSILTEQKVKSLLKNYDVILPKKRNYFIESTYNQYMHAHNKQDLDKTYEIIKENCPEYISAWESVMKSAFGHRFNMFIMKKEILDSYLIWLFGILFRLEEVLDISGYSVNDQRVFGFVAERLLDVWIITNNIRYTELPVIYMESQNWPRKVRSFLKRKFFEKNTAD